MTLATKPVAASAPAAPLEFVAIVTAEHAKLITPDFEGRVKKLYVHGNSLVKAGDVIAELDTSELVTQMKQALASESSASAESGAAGSSAGEGMRQANLQRQLASLGAAAPNAYLSEQAKAHEAGGRAAAAAANASRYREVAEDYKTKISHAKLVAPMDGMISTLKVKEGELAHKGTPIGRVFDQQDLLVRFAVPREHRKEVKDGMRMEFFALGLEHRVFAKVEHISEELEPPINYTMVEAKIETNKLAPDEVRVALTGHVRLADAGGKR